MTIETERLIIRHVIPDDLKVLQQIDDDFNNSEYVYYDTPHHISENELKLIPPGEHLFIVSLKNEKTGIGYINFYREAGIYSIGYCFHRSYQHKGYATESVVAFLNYQHSRGVQECIAGTAEKNIPSVKFLKKLGFEQYKKEILSFHKNVSFTGIWAKRTLPITEFDIKYEVY